MIYPPEFYFEFKHELVEKIDKDFTEKQIDIRAEKYFRRIQRRAFLNGWLWTILLMLFTTVIYLIDKKLF